MSEFNQESYQKMKIILKNIEDYVRKEESKLQLEFGGNRTEMLNRLFVVFKEETSKQCTLLESTNKSYFASFFNLKKKNKPKTASITMEILDKIINSCQNKLSSVVDKPEIKNTDFVSEILSFISNAVENLPHKSENIKSEDLAESKENSDGLGSPSPSKPEFLEPENSSESNEIPEFSKGLISWSPCKSEIVKSEDLTKEISEKQVRYSPCKSEGMQSEDIRESKNASEFQENQEYLETINKFDSIMEIASQSKPQQEVSAQSTETVQTENIETKEKFLTRTKKFSDLSILNETDIKNHTLTDDEIQDSYFLTSEEVKNNWPIIWEMGQKEVNNMEVLETALEQPTEAVPASDDKTTSDIVNQEMLAASMTENKIQNDNHVCDEKSGDPEQEIISALKLEFTPETSICDGDQYQLDTQRESVFDNARLEFSNEEAFKAALLKDRKLRTIKHKYIVNKAKRIEMDRKRKLKEKIEKKDKRVGLILENIQKNDANRVQESAQKYNKIIDHARKMHEQKKLNAQNKIKAKKERFEEWTSRKEDEKIELEKEISQYEEYYQTVYENQCEE